MEESLRPKRKTFVVHVLYQQNNTWQGEVLWAEQQEKRHFRSALELIRFMDGAMGEEQGKNQTERLE